MWLHVLHEILDIVLGELTVETLLHILDFLGFDWVLIVSSGLINKSLVECTLQKKVEVGHESGIVAVLVLCENRVQSEVDL